MEIDRLIHTGDRQESTAGEAADVVDTPYNDDDFFFWNSAGWEITRQLIVKLKADVEAAGSRLVVMHFPSEGLVRDGVPLPHPEFDAFLEQNDIPYVSLFPGYLSMDAGELRTHFIPGDGHWTPPGHRHVARQTRARCWTRYRGHDLRGCRALYHPFWSSVFFSRPAL